jgi:hypothetical protein
MKKIINFQNEKIGPYSASQINKSWNNPPRTIGAGKRAFIVKENNKKVLMIKYPKETFGLEGGAQWRLKFEKNYNEIYAQFKVMFPKGFNFVKGGKLPGLCGGSSPAGGKKCIGDGFSARIMWRGEENGKKGSIVQYMYYPGKDPSRNWGEDFYWLYKKKKVYFIPGKWHELKTRIKLGKVGKKNDLVESWFDGKKVLKIKLILRAKEQNFGIDSFNFTTIFGGNDKTWAPKKDESVLFDNFILSDKTL